MKPYKPQLIIGIIMAAVALMVMAIASCTGSTENKQAVPLTAAQQDSLTVTMMMDSIDRIYCDTANLASSPIIILSAIAEEFQGQYYKKGRVVITYKNISAEPVRAIRLRWKGVNDFNEPVLFDGGRSIGYDEDETDSPAAPGQTSRLVKEYDLANCKKIIAAWPYEIALADGTTWKASGR
jgi:hypothetical protein